MIRIRRSRAYFGRNLHGEGPIAYLCLDADAPGESLGSARVLSCLSQLQSVLSAAGPHPVTAAGAAAWSSAHSALPEQRLWGLIATAIDWVLHWLGEAESAVQRPNATAAECALEFLIACGDAETARRAGDWSVRALDGWLALGSAICDAQLGPSDAPAPELWALRDFAESRRASPATMALMNAASERRIPVIELDRWPFDGDHIPPAASFGRRLQFGWGRFAARLHGTAADSIPALTHATLRDRHACYDRLSSAGLPVPYRDPELRNINRASRASRVAEKIGYPVRIKSAYRGAVPAASVALLDEVAVRAAYATLADVAHRQVLVERYVQGDTYRLLVVGQTVVAATRRTASAGASASCSAVLERLNPDRFCAGVKAAAVSACARHGLPLAAVELVTVDPSAPLQETGGVLTDVDPAPDLGDYTLPGEGLPMTAARQYLGILFPTASQARIPICAITGTNGKTTTSRMVASILQGAGRRVGLACTDGVYIQGERLKAGTFSGVAGALSVLLQRDVEVAVLETSRGTLVRKGLAFDRCDVAACTNVASDHLDEEGIETLEQMAALKRLVVESAHRCAVLNADDPRCRAMLPHLTARHVYLISRAAAVEQMDAHVLSGGTAVVLQRAEEGQVITLRTQAGDQPIVTTDRIPATFRSTATHNIENAMFAAALAHGLGVSIPTIREALEAFSSSIEVTPGRLNLITGLPFDVILDYAHNPHGIRALCRFIDRLRTTGRRHIVVYWNRQTPREADLTEAMGIIAARFDRFICRDAADTAADATGKTAQQVATALVAAGASRDAVSVIPDLPNAIDTALAAAQPGDLVVIITGSKAPTVWQQVQRFQQQLQFPDNGVARNPTHGHTGPSDHMG